MQRERDANQLEACNTGQKSLENDYQDSAAASNGKNMKDGVKKKKRKRDIG
jgi:hypothetical protein